MPQDFPWGLVAAGAALIALAVAVRYPGARRWIAALAVLVLFGFAAIIVLLIGAISRMDVGGGLPLAATLGSAGLALAGLVIAGLIAFWRRRAEG